MSWRLLGRSSDLRRLVDDGYELEVRAGYLIVRHVPYVDQERRVACGELVLELTLAGEVTAKPDHVARFAGSTPCDEHGRPLTKIINSSRRQQLASGVVIDHIFSAKPIDPGGYPDYYEKVVAYVSMLSGPAERIDPTATARTYHVFQADDEANPFVYLDTATPRTGLEMLTEQLRRERIGIVGLGGTGSYVFDYVAKTPVREIHLYDGDRFLQHNAFRAPGATPIEELEAGPNKAEHWATVYRRLRRHGIVAHPVMVDETNLAELLSLDFVFVAVDDGAARRRIVTALEEAGVPCIDVGMGIYEAEGRLAGQARVSTATEGHPTDKARIPFGEDPPGNEYAHNIQIAELNALNAALAVIKWKKLAGFYADTEHEHFASYVLAGNRVINDDCQ